METLPRDVEQKILLNLLPNEIINYCLSAKEKKQRICDSRNFWMLKISVDYPNYFKYIVNNNLVLTNPKNTYIRKFKKEMEILERHNIEPKYYNGFFQSLRDILKLDPKELAKRRRELTGSSKKEALIFVLCELPEVKEIFQRNLPQVNYDEKIKKLIPLLLSDEYGKFLEQIY